MIKLRPRAKRQEFAGAMKYARQHPVYKPFAPPDEKLKLDLVVLFILDEKVAQGREEVDRKNAERRKANPKIRIREPNLAFLVGTTIRDLFGYKKKKRQKKLAPEEEARAREIEALIKAYEGLMMWIFRQRKEYQKKQKAAAEKERSHPEHSGGQFRLT